MNWLLLRGLAREQRHWGAFPSLLAEALGEPVHLLDLPGAGSEASRASPGTIRGIATDVRARWGPMRAAAPGPWAVFGISLGGMVAMQWAADFPGDFARAVVVNSSASNLSAPWRRLDWRVLPRVVRALFERDAEARERRILGMTTCLLADRASVARDWARLARERPMTRANVLRHLWAASRFRAPRRLDCPALVLSGGRDPFTDPSCPARLASHLGATLALHPEAGHDLPLDDAPWVVREVKEWCAPATTRRAAG